MRKTMWLVIPALIAACGGGDDGGSEPSAPAPSEPAVGTVEMFVELDQATEGLTFGVDEQGQPALYIGGGTVMRRISASREVSKIADVPAPLGMALMQDGNVVVCGRATGDLGKSDHPGALWKVTPAGQATMIASSSADLFLDLPNMIAVGPGGELVFSDSKGGKVFKANADGSGLTRLTDAIPYPNGVAFRQDGSAVLVASYESEKIYSMARDASGNYGPPEVFAEGVKNVDGLAPLASGGFALVQTGEGLNKLGADKQKTPIAPGINADIPSNGACGVGAFGEKWFYVANLFAKKISRVYLGEACATLPIRGG